MGKRKSDCSINDLIVQYLKKRKCARTLKLFENTNENSKNENICENFLNYLEKKESEKVNVEDELGFEINFRAYQPEVKVSHNI